MPTTKKVDTNPASEGSTVHVWVSHGKSVYQALLLKDNDDGTKVVRYTCNGVKETIGPNVPVEYDTGGRGQRKRMAPLSTHSVPTASSTIAKRQKKSKSTNSTGKQAKSSASKSSSTKPMTKKTAIANRHKSASKPMNGSSGYEDFKCPITLELPFDPVTADDGKVYERAAIEEYFEGQAKGGRKVISPCTREPMSKKLYPARFLKNSIQTLIDNGQIAGKEADNWNAKVQGKKKKDSLLKKASEGDVKSIECVATSFEYGEAGFREDKKEAFSWYKKAHDAGSVLGTAAIGYMWAVGEGVCRNQNKGSTYLALAAGRGSAFAAQQIGFACADGLYGLDIDKSEAIRWLEQCLSTNSTDLLQVGQKEARKKLTELKSGRS